MKLTKDQFMSMLDLTVLAADSTHEELDRLSEFAKKHNVGLVGTFPSLTPYLISKLADRPDIKVGAVAGFPTGSTTTKMKVLEAQEQLEMGCSELDMVMNIGLFKSGKYDEVYEDIKNVTDVFEGKIRKVIIEAHYLTDDEIIRACEICMKAKVDFVKTSTGWAPTGATLENITLMKSVVKDTIKIKAAAGMRGLDTVAEIHKRGASRFGIGLRLIGKIIEQFEKYPEGYKL